MRRIAVITAALILVMCGPSFAQEWIQYASRTDFFGVNFPGEPNVNDLSKWTEMQGTVKEVHLLVPHSWIYFEVTDEKGEVTTWALEATGPGGLQRVGIKRQDVLPGDTVKVRCHLLRDGERGCLLGYVTPTHGDVARGHGVEKDWDGGGGAGTPVPR